MTSMSKTNLKQPRAETGGPQPRNLTEGEVYSIHSVTAGNVSAYRCTAAPQLRNWSLVGQGESVTDNGKTEKLFLKQFVDRSGKFLPENFNREVRAHLLAEDLFGDGIKVASIRVVDTVNLVLGYEYIDVTPFDELLRSDPKQFAQHFPAVLPRLVQILTALVEGAHLVRETSSRNAAFEGPSSVVFRGLDVRNMGLVPSNRTDRPYDLCIFDFENTYKGFAAEACAKLFVSIGMLNWGRPLSRFARGPDLSLLDQAFAYLHPFCRRDAIQQRLDHDFAQRQRVVKAVNGLESAAKKLGIQILGRRYFNALKTHAASLSFPAN